MEAFEIAQILRSRRRRTLGLEITPEARVVLRVPARVPEAAARQWAYKKSRWVLRHLDAVRRRIAEVPRLQNGGPILYRGESRGVSFREKLHPAVLFQDGFIVRSGETQEVRRRLVRWFRRAAKSVFSGRVRDFAESTGLRPHGLRISSGRRTWGSANRKGTVSLSWRLLMAPPFVLDYVIVHELVHLRIRNHSRSFWERVASIDPRYREARSWLTAHAHLLDF
jgi:predicted metal-dependent hydrolase